MLDEMIYEVFVGKGLFGVFKLLKDRGLFKEIIEWGGRNMDKKKSKLVGIYDDEGFKEIYFERIDEYGRIVSILFISFDGFDNLNLCKLFSYLFRYELMLYFDF